jgi:hypothetical protein
LTVDKSAATSIKTHASMIRFDLCQSERYVALSCPATPADDRDCKVPFSFTGKINKATFALDKPRLPPEDVKRFDAASRAARDAN